MKSADLLPGEAGEEIVISFFLAGVECGLYFFAFFFMLQNKIEKPGLNLIRVKFYYRAGFYLQNCLRESIAACKPISAAVCRSLQAASVLLRKISAIPLL